MLFAFTVKPAAAVRDHSRDQTFELTLKVLNF